MTSTVTEVTNTKDHIEPTSIRVEDKVYSAEKLAAMHPGGPLFIKVVGTCYVEQGSS